MQKLEHHFVTLNTNLIEFVMSDEETLPFLAGYLVTPIVIVVLLAFLIHCILSYQRRRQEGVMQPLLPSSEVQPFNLKPCNLNSRK